MAEILRGVPRDGQVRWVSKDQLHITLRFIGDFEESHLPELESVLKNVSHTCGPFELELGGLDAFPRLERAKVLFVPVVRGEEGLRQLEKAMTINLAGLGIKPEDKEYHPHLTLGRVRENGNPKAGLAALKEVLPSNWPPWKVGRFVLFKSRLASGGAVYTQLMEFGLGL